MREVTTMNHAILSAFLFSLLSACSISPERLPYLTELELCAVAMQGTSVGWSRQTESDARGEVERRGISCKDIRARYYASPQYQYDQQRALMMMQTGAALMQQSTQPPPPTVCTASQLGTTTHMVCQ